MDDAALAADGDLRALRLAFAQGIVRAAGAHDAALVAAFAAVPRERFVGPPPWRVLDGGEQLSIDPRHLYADVLVSLVPERGINNGQPSLHAQCLAAARLALGETVLHVGAGSGYYSAVMAQLVGATGRVEAYEIEPHLAERARANLAPWPVVQVHAASALGSGLPHADFIYVNAGATHPPAAWLDALAPGGRLILPLTADNGHGAMLRLVRATESGTSLAARFLAHVSFIDCVGARDENEARALRGAFAAGRSEDVRSLHRGTPPDDSAWCVGDGWWLSTAPLSAG